MLVIMGTGLCSPAPDSFLHQAPISASSQLTGPNNHWDLNDAAYSVLSLKINKPKITGCTSKQIYPQKIYINNNSI